MIRDRCPSPEPDRPALGRDDLAAPVGSVDQRCRWPRLLRMVPSASSRRTASHSIRGERRATSRALVEPIRSAMKRKGSGQTDPKGPAWSESGPPTPLPPARFRCRMAERPPDVGANPLRRDSGIVPTSPTDLASDRASVPRGPAIRREMDRPRSGLKRRTLPAGWNGWAVATRRRIPVDSGEAPKRTAISSSSLAVARSRRDRNAPAKPAPATWVNAQPTNRTPIALRAQGLDPRRLETSKPTPARPTYHRSLATQPEDGPHREAVERPPLPTRPPAPWEGSNFVNDLRSLAHLPSVYCRSPIRTWNRRTPRSSVDQDWATLLTRSDPRAGPRRLDRSPTLPCPPDRPLTVRIGRRRLEWPRRARGLRPQRPPRVERPVEKAPPKTPLSPRRSPAPPATTHPLLGQTVRPAQIRLHSRFVRASELRCESIRTPPAPPESATPKSPRTLAPIRWRDRALLGPAPTHDWTATLDRDRTRAPVQPAPTPGVPSLLRSLPTLQ